MTTSSNPSDSTVTSSATPAESASKVTTTMTNGGSAGGEAQSTKSQAIFWLVFWFTLNCGTTILNKAIFKNFHFPYPVTVSSIHMAFTAALTWVSMRYMGIEMNTVTSRGHFQLFLFSLLFCANIACGNLGLKYATVALSQVIRATIPGITMALSIPLLQQSYTPQQVATVVVVAFGVMMATYGDMEFSMLGCILTFMGCVLSSLKSITAKKFLTGSLRFHPLELAHRMSTYAMVTMSLLAVILGEWDEIAEDPGEVFTTPMIMILSANGAMAFLLNFSNFMLTKVTSPLTVTVAGSAKNATTIVLGVVIFHTPVSLLNGIGTVLALIGATAYGVIEQLNRSRTIPRVPVSPSQPPSPKQADVRTCNV